PLSSARHISEHRRGFASVTVTVTGRFGITYVGDPVTPLPTSETRPVEPEYGWLVKPLPIRPMWNEFYIDGAPLFDACRSYLNAAQHLVQEARAISIAVHGSKSLTLPPDDL